MSGTLPTHMRAIAIAEPGGPDVLRPETVPVPRAGPGEVLIRVAAAGVNRPDILQRQGAYPPPPGAPETPGLEVSGTVVDVGDGVADHRAGDPVCALLAGGGYAQYAVAPAPQVLPVPDGTDLTAAAALPETFFTVWTNVFERGRLGPGESLLVHGGSSGIGTTAIQLATARGHAVFCTVGSAAKAAACAALGARAIVYRDTDFAEVIAAETRDGVDVILDMVGGDYAARNLASLAVEGRCVQIAVQRGSRARLDLALIMRRRLTLTGSTLRPRTAAQKGAIAGKLLTAVWPLIAAGRIRPVIHRTFPLEQAAAAHRLMESGTHIGKIVLTV